MKCRRCPNEHWRYRKSRLLADRSRHGPVHWPLLTTACQQEMARQPSYRPLESTDFFPDGRASRPLVEGTVARGRPFSRRVGDPDLSQDGPARGDAARAAAVIGNSALNPLAALLSPVHSGDDWSRRLRGRLPDRDRSSKAIEPRGARSRFQHLLCGLSRRPGHRQRQGRRAGGYSSGRPTFTRTTRAASSAGARRCSCAMCPLAISSKSSHAATAGCPITPARYLQTTAGRSSLMSAPCSSVNGRRSKTCLPETSRTRRPERIAVGRSDGEHTITPATRLESPPAPLPN